MKIKHLVLGVVMALIACIAWAQERPSTLFGELDKTINKGMSDFHLPGVAVCAARGQRVIFCRNYGYADVATRRRITSKTPFVTGSITKTFTAIATMKLVERGVIGLDDRVADLVDFKLGHSGSESLTLRHLLTHTGAINDNENLAPLFFTLNPDLDISLADASSGFFALGGKYYDPIKNFIDVPPGTLWAYSNAGFALTGRINELAGNVDFRKLVKKTILDPLEMSDSTLHLGEVDRKRVALAHRWNGERYDVTPPFTYSFYPAGFLYASAYDLVRYAAAVGDPVLLEARGVLNRASRAELLRPQLADEERGQALGFYYEQLDGNAVYGHDGSFALGVFSKMMIRESDGLSVVFLANGTPIPETDGPNPPESIWRDQVLKQLFKTATALK